MQDYTDQFVLSQYHYYKKHFAYRGHGDGMVRSLFYQFEAEAKKRKLI